MQNILEILNSFGLNININGNNNPLFYIALAYLIFTTIILISVVNISIYLLSIYIVNNNVYLDKISSRFPIVTKLVKYYNGTRISFILIELAFLFGSIGYMLYLSISIIKMLI